MRAFGVCVCVVCVCVCVVRVCVCCVCVLCVVCVCVDTICTTILSIIVSKRGVHCFDIQVDVRVIGIRTCLSIR